MRSSSGLPLRVGLLLGDFWRDIWIVFFAFIVIVGIFMGQGLVIAFAFMGLLTGTIAVVWSRVALDNVCYKRLLPQQSAFLGDEIPLTVALTNKKPVPLSWIKTVEDFPEGLQLLDGDTVWNAYSKIQHLRHSTSMAWYERIRWDYRLRCTRRGVYRLGPARIESGDPFGFRQSQVTADQGDTIVVYPRIISLKELGLPPARPLGDVKGGIRIFQDPSRPSGIRDYQKDDPVKTIDWKATARTQRLQVRTFEPSSNLTVVLVVGVDTNDRYWTPDYPEALERVITAIASVASYAAEQGYNMGLFSNDIPSLAGRTLIVPPGRGPDQLGEVLSALASIRSFAVGPLAEQLVEHSQQFPIGATLVIATAYLPLELNIALGELKDQGYKVVLLYVGDGETPKMAEGVLVHEIRGQLINAELREQFGGGR